MIRVLYILPELTDQLTTAAHVRASALLPLLARQTDLVVLTFERAGNAKIGVEGLKENKIIRVLRKKPSILSLALGTLMPKPRAFRRFDIALARSAVLDALKAHQPDIVHFDGFATLGLMKLVRSLRPECKIIAHIHDAQSARLLPATRSGNLAYRIQKSMEYRKSLRFEQHQLCNADLTIVDSDEDRDYLRKQMGSNAVDTLPLGFDFVSFDTESKNAHLKQPAIVYSGSMKADQSVDAAIFLAREVMPLVWQTNKDAHLYIVGGGPTDEVLSLASDRIHVTGYVRDMASYLRSCRVYVCPLRLGSGMRTRVVEALACGVSMVATSMAVRGIGTPKAGAAWIAAETAPEFAVSIISVLNGLHPSLPEIGARYVRENFSWPILASKLITYYAMVLKQ